MNRRELRFHRQLCPCRLDRRERCVERLADCCQPGAWPQFDQMDTVCGARRPRKRSDRLGISRRLPASLSVQRGANAVLQARAGEEALPGQAHEVDCSMWSRGYVGASAGEEEGPSGSARLVRAWRRAAGHGGCRERWVRVWRGRGEVWKHAGES
jgi:hypothetical protein